jgi:hypothetical protein
MIGDLHRCKSSFMYFSHDPPTFSLCGFKWLNVLPLTKMRMIPDTSTLMLILSHAKLLFCSHFEYQIYRPISEKLWLVFREAGSQVRLLLYLLWETVCFVVGWFEIAAGCTGRVFGCRWYSHINQTSLTDAGLAWLLRTASYHFLTLPTLLSGCV